MLVQSFMLGHFCVGRGTLSWEVLPSHPPIQGVIRDHGYSLMKLSSGTFIMENAAPKGIPNMKVTDFQVFVNTILLKDVCR